MVQAVRYLYKCWTLRFLKVKNVAHTCRSCTIVFPGLQLRRSRDEKRRSATERLFPSTSSQTGSSSADASQRFSDLVNARPYSVRPSSLTEPISKFSLNQTRSSPNTVATVRPVSSYTANSQPRSSFSNKNYDNRSPTTVAVKPFPTNTSDVDEGLEPSKREKIRERHKGTPKARFLTVSSSSPVKLEQSPVKREFKHTAAGDLIISSVSFLRKYLALVFILA